jgi:hypothetical protein
MTTYTWRVLSVRSEPDYQGIADFVTDVQWELGGLSDDYQVQAYLDGWQHFEPQTDVPCLSRAELTDDIILNWIFGSLGEERIAQLKAEIDNMILTAPRPD